MADVVTIDPINLRFIEISTGTDNSIDWVEVYSEWKDWLLADPSRLKYPQAFAVVGGDPITDIQNLGSTFFLENKWRFRPAEHSHRIELVGNCFTREPGGDVSVDTIGDYRVTVALKVSNLVDASVARLDLDQLLQAVYINTISGVPGTTGSIGTPTNPVSNITDAFIIATEKNLSSYNITGPCALDQDYTNWTFNGAGAHVDNTTLFNFAGYDVNRCLFHDMNLTGSMTGKIEAHECGLSVLAGLDGFFITCGFFDSFLIDDDALIAFHDCFSVVAGTGHPVCTVGSNVALQFRGYSGGIGIRALTAGCTVSADLAPGRVKVYDDCTGGLILVRGSGDLIDESGGLVTIDESGLVFSGTEQTIADEVHSRGMLSRRLNLEQIEVNEESVLREII